MDLTKMRKSSISELQKHILKLQTEIANMRRDSLLTPESNVRKIRNIKREIARAKTIINENSTGENDE